MDVTRLSIARVLELGVPVTWQEASAVVFESVDRAQQLGGSHTERVSPDCCLITRGGEVVLSEQAERTHPEVVAALAADLLRGCDEPGELGAALASGRLLPFLEAFSHDTTWKRRRVQIAAVALRAIAAHADEMRAKSATTARVAGGTTAPMTRREPRRTVVATSPPPPQRMRQRLGPLDTAPRRRISARLIIWTVVAISVTAVGLSAWRAENGLFAAPPAAQAPLGRR